MKTLIKAKIRWILVLSSVSSSPEEQACIWS